MKQVPACEYNPSEAISTNVLGAQNVVDAAINAGVKQVVALSTDKAVNPVNLYGATKLCAEKIVVQGNAYASRSGTKLELRPIWKCRWFTGIRSPAFCEAETARRLTLTDERMTRFWITLDQAVDLVIFSLDFAVGGEVFVPKIPSVQDHGSRGGNRTGSTRGGDWYRPGEKLHEALLTTDETETHHRVTGTFRHLARASMVDGQSWLDRRKAS